MFFKIKFVTFIETPYVSVVRCVHMECWANKLHIRYINVNRFNNGKHVVIYRNREPNRHLLKLTISIP